MDGFIFICRSAFKRRTEEDVEYFLSLSLGSISRTQIEKSLLFLSPESASALPPHTRRQTAAMDGGSVIPAAAVVGADAAGHALLQSAVWICRASLSLLRVAFVLALTPAGCSSSSDFRTEPPSIPAISLTLHVFTT